MEVTALEVKDLVSQINIVEYIGQYTDLELRGDEWWGLSPFTEEKTPSFSVKEDPPFFYDFSSGLSGNLFNFIKEYNHCTSQRAIEILKDYIGFNGEIKIGNEKLTATKVCEKYKNKKTHEKIAKNTILPDDYMERYEVNIEKLRVWEDEGISGETLKKFQVRYDGFSDRLVYPIRNLDGKIINVGGRTLDKNWKELNLRKYNYYFAWGTISTIYGLYENMKEILQKHEVIIFEGCKSVLISDTWGIKNTAAILTSHLSKMQMKILARLGCRVIFALDKDVVVRNDKNIKVLKDYANVEYIYDINNLLGEKDSPVDKGLRVFESLYNNRFKYR